ncbi:MAG TPA: helix-turn-helix transcriptional regulator [Thermoanaerobaculia bacterium]|jgi:tetratricopeptide (TPR) repeat protein|nr:helix-turn-helix transcriptional regulator [Thermoanaerobaculia bacterium]
MQGTAKGTNRKKLHTSEGSKGAFELIPGPELGRSLKLFRVSLGLTQAELSEVTGVNRANLSAYETGRHCPRPATRARIESAGSRPPAFSGEPAVERTIAEREREVAEAALGEVAVRLAGGGEEGERAEEERAFARRLWQKLAPLAKGERIKLVDLSPPFQAWAFVERLAHESEREVARDTDEARFLAELAFRVAEKISASAFGAAAREYAWVYLGNVYRVIGDHVNAESAFAAAKRETPSAGASPFSRSRILDREAALCRGRRQFAKAFKLYEGAFSVARPSEIGFLELNQAFTLQQAGRSEDAIAALRRAVEALETQADGPDNPPRVRWGALFNLAVNLFDLERPAEAEGLLPQVRALVESENDLDQLRLQWLEAKAAAGAGRPDEAISALIEVKQEFEDKGLGYDAALAALEASAWLLDQGRAAEARALIEESQPTFAGLKIRREGIASIALFAESLRQETATARQAREVLRGLQRRG